MRRVLGPLLIGVTVVAAAACGLEESGGLKPTPDAGAAGSLGSGGSVSGNCFPGAKVCPDAASGKLTCVAANTPETGCADSTGCTPCVLAHATAQCAGSGECEIAACDGGWQDCNGSAVDGCETNVDGDHSNCGACGTDCMATKGQNWICEAGTCIVNYCDPDTLLDCDKDKSNGCEVDSKTDAANCKFCGNACDLPNAFNECQNQACVIKSCKGGWANCDGIEANGCETNIGTDPGHCGGCGTQCNTTNGLPSCTAGKCGITCTGSFGNCDGNVGNGCETDKNTAVAHCGACGGACALANANPACSGGSCQIASCKGSWANCDGKVASGCEINTANNTSHCGGCNKPCLAPTNATPTCANGGCGFACNTGFSTCGSGSTCFNLSNDPNHCGSTCKPCAGPPSGQGAPICSGGACNVACKSGFSKCGLDCFDLKTDSAHCGTCTKVCAAPTGGSTSCVGGACVPACPGALTLCGNACVDTNANGAHCGGCGQACGGGKVCTGGSCQCPSGKKDCSGVCLECCGNADCGGGDKCCTGTCKSSC